MVWVFSLRTAVLSSFNKLWSCITTCILPVLHSIGNYKGYFPNHCMLKEYRFLVLAATHFYFPHEYDVVVWAFWILWLILLYAYSNVRVFGPWNSILPSIQYMMVRNIRLKGAIWRNFVFSCIFSVLQVVHAFIRHRKLLKFKS